MAIRTVEWLDGTVPAVRLLDQTRLPVEEVYVEAADVDTLVDAIRRLAVRGAPALGAVGALGVAIARPGRARGLGRRPPAPRDRPPARPGRPR